jgi:NitT/TauT family transport system permease protein
VLDEMNVKQDVMVSQVIPGKVIPASRKRSFSWLGGSGSKLISLVLLVSVWWLLSLYLGEHVLPSPLLTVETLLKDIQKGNVFNHLGITLSRVFLAFFLTMIVGITLGCLLGLSKRFRSFFSFWIVIGLSIPALVYIVVIFLWLGLSEASAIVATMMTTVFTITMNIWEGVKSLDKKLLELGTVLRARRSLVIRRIVLPQLYPYMMASARFGLGLTWKMVIFVELMGRSNGIGYMINYWYQMYNMSHVLGYAFIFIVVMLIIEVILNVVIEPKLFAWRPKKA